ncbi:hypothetical protein ACIBF1_45600 [Spirillospora sp. NPDC050679]
MTKTLRPVVDPTLPPDVRALLLNAPAGLAPASGPAPLVPPRGGRTGSDVMATLSVATLCGFVPVLAAPYLLGLKGLVAGVIAQAGLVFAWQSGGFTRFLIVGTVLQLVCWVLLFVSGGGEDEHVEAAREYHGRYYLEDDFGSGKKLQRWLSVSPQKLMERTQTAIAAVLESEVDSAGLLDDTANAVVLPQQEWEIAQALVELTRIWRQLNEIVTEESSARVLATVKPQREALKTSAAALTRRVEALERYADRTRAADVAYREWRTLRELEELNDDTLDMLARTVRDELAAAEIDALADRSGLEPLRDSLREAREAAQVLAEPVEGARA